ncbi:Hypothetical protein GbCGDNIH6_7239 [Granulibacter bethesdensis]|nr:Hypothetical protein GbCGDNIH6_7239 [Granulibacter bethesdensis]
MVSGVGLTGLIVACSVPSDQHYADIAARIPEPFRRVKPGLD